MQLMWIDWPMISAVDVHSAKYVTAPSAISYD